MLMKHLQDVHMSYASHLSRVAIESHPLGARTLAMDLDAQGQRRNLRSLMLPFLI